jgi:hypothetical protein
MEKIRNVLKILFRIYNGKRTFEILVCKWKDSIKIERSIERKTL